MGNRTPRGADDRPESSSGLPTDRETTDARVTRRGVLGRASALGVLPLSGLVGRGRADIAGPSSTGPPETPDSEAVDPSLVFETRFDEELTAFDHAQDGGYVLTGESYVEGTKVWFVWTDARGDPLVKRSLDFPERYSDPERHSYPTATDVVADDDGVAILGEVRNLDLCWLRSVDADGDTCWSREYSTSGRGDCRSLARTAEGGYAWVTDGVLHVVDADGELRWRRSYTCSQISTGDPEWDPDRECVPELSVVVPLDEGGFLLAGRFRGGLEVSRVWVGRVDESGALLDDTLFEGSGYYSVFDAVPAGDRGMALVGRFGDYGGSTTHPYTDPLFMRVNAELELRAEGLRWGTGVPNPQWFGTVAANAIAGVDGGFVLAGSGEVSSPMSEPRPEARFIGITPDGTVRWTYRYPEDDSIPRPDRLVGTPYGFAAIGSSSYTGGWLAELAVERSC